MSDREKILDQIELCPNNCCDKGKIITDAVAEDGKFELVNCLVCKGRGFLYKER